MEAAWTLRDYCYLAGVVIALLSAVIAFFSARFTAKRDLNSLGDSEIKTFEMIARAEKDFADLNVKFIGKYVAEPEKAPNEEIEHHTYYTHSVLNAYEIACQRYRDGKLDKGRFKKTYSARIKKLCSSTPYKEKLSDNNFNFSALEMTNREFNNPENS
ncbi:hypothetical protein [Pectobacterium aroidearum]|uniref:hypothetical protein n=1 Tax=Pectobacterium aroidearum TaxID=1201031 RepID=UPI0032EC1B7F